MRSRGLRADKPRDGFGAGEEDVEVAFRVFLGEHFAEAAAEGDSVWIADDGQTYFVLAKLLQDCARLTRAEIEEASGQTGSVQKDGVRAVGKATLKNESGVSRSAHEAVFGLGLDEATPDLFDKTQAGGSGLRIGPGVREG